MCPPVQRPSNEPSTPNLVVVGEEGFAARAAAEVTARLRSALEERGVAAFALAGGATPRPVYRTLADGSAGLKPAKWNRIHFSGAMSVWCRPVILAATLLQPQRICLWRSTFRQVSVESKAEVVRRAFENEDPSLPATRVNPRSGSLCRVLGFGCRQSSTGQQRP